MFRVAHHIHLAIAVAHSQGHRLCNFGILSSLLWLWSGTGVICEPGTCKYILVWGTLHHLKCVLPDSPGVGGYLHAPQHAFVSTAHLSEQMHAPAQMMPFMPIMGEGRTRLQPTWVRDVADAIIHSLKLKEALGKDYYLAGPEVLTCAPAPAHP